MDIKNKIAAVSVGAVTSIAAVTGLAALAGAQTSTTPADATTQNQSAPTEGIAQDPAASEGLQNEANEANEGPEDEAAENAALADQASITAAEAEQAATVAVPGTADPAELENENGTVVYEVLVTDEAGVMHEVKIDATTGAVTDQSVEEAEGPEDEANEGPEDEANEAARN